MNKFDPWRALGAPGLSAQSTMIKWLLGGILTALFGVLAMSFIFYAMPVRAPVQNPSVDYILVEKHRHLMQLFSRGKIVKEYAIALGRGGSGPKSVAGDNKVPEGTYRITGRNPRSAFHLSLRIGYPNEQQRRTAKQFNVDPGGDVMIHGIRKGFGWLGAWHRKLDWTRGCIAVTDGEIEEVWSVVADGTVVEIRP